MDPAEIDRLANHLLEAANRRRDSGKRVLVGVAGIPGSGKSSLAYPLEKRLNELAGCHDEKDAVALCVGGDGWHLSQAQMRVMDDADMLFERRGAHFTFDGVSYAAFVRALDEHGDEPVPFPTFSHADKDPVERGGFVLPQHRIVVIEGLYTFLDVEPWSEPAHRLDERIWVDVPKKVARERLVGRHLSEGVESTREGAIKRAEQSDLLNGDFIIQHALPPTFSVSGEASSSSEASSMANSSAGSSANSSTDELHEMGGASSTKQDLPAPTTLRTTGQNASAMPLSSLTAHIVGA